MARHVLPDAPAMTKGSRKNRDYSPSIGRAVPEVYSKLRRPLHLVENYVKEANELSLLSKLLHSGQISKRCTASQKEDA